MDAYQWLITFSIILLPAIGGALTAGIDRLAEALERRES